MSSLEAFVDTNILVRMITNDDEDQVGQLRPWVQAVESGNVTWHLTVLVIAETIWVLKRAYTPGDIGRTLQALIRADGVVTEQKEAVLLALEWVESGRMPAADFTDAYLAARARLENRPVLTWDRHYRRVDAQTLSPSKDPDRFLKTVDQGE